MTCSSIKVPLVTSNALNGIIAKLKQSYSNELILTNFVVPSAIRDENGNRKELVTWEFFNYQAGPGTSTNFPWIQLSFPNHFIFPTAYSMRGVTSGWCFSKQWEVFGIHEGDDSNETKWEKLGQNSTDESTYCNKISSNKSCIDDRVGTFTLKPMTSRKGFKHIRLRASGGGTNRCLPNFYLPISGIDFYGTLSSNPYNLGSKNARTKISPFIIYLCTNIIIS